MTEQTHEQMTEYEKFRLQKLEHNHDDDNFSAHFSNMSANISMMARSQRQIKINSFRSSHENEEDFKNIQIDSKTIKLQQMTKKYNDLQDKYNQLLILYKSKEGEAEKYKKLYQQEISRERQTKQKLKNWVKQAKTNLNR